MSAVVRRLFKKVTLGWFPSGSIYLLFRFTLNNEGCCWETLVSAPLDLVLSSLATC